MRSSSHDSDIARPDARWLRKMGVGLVRCGRQGKRKNDIYRFVLGRTDRFANYRQITEVVVWAGLRLSGRYRIRTNAETPGILDDSLPGGAESGAVHHADPELDVVLAAWPHLDDAARRAILWVVWQASQPR